MTAAEKFQKTATLAIETMVKIKKVMKDKNLRACRCACTAEGCAGTIHATLNGRKNHLHFRCDACGLQAME